MKVEGNVFVVTGASDGLGKAISEKLVQRNGKVALLARSEEKLNELAQKLGENSISIICDVTKPEDLEKAKTVILEKFGKINGLFNNAGLWYKTKPIEESSYEEITEVLDVNLKGLIYSTKTFLPEIKKSEEGMVVNISSKSGTRPMDLQTVYCASKYGVKGFTDTLKLELKKSSVKVLGIYPSGMNTKMFEKSGEEFSSETFMKVEEIAEIVVFAIERPGNISIEEIQIEKY